MMTAFDIIIIYFSSNSTLAPCVTVPPCSAFHPGCVRQTVILNPSRLKPPLGKKPALFHCFLAMGK